MFAEFFGVLSSIVSLWTLRRCFVLSILVCDDGDDEENDGELLLHFLFILSSANSNQMLIEMKTRNRLFLMLSLIVEFELTWRKQSSRRKRSPSRRRHFHYIDNVFLHFHHHHYHHYQRRRRSLRRQPTFANANLKCEYIIYYMIIMIIIYTYI